MLAGLALFVTLFDIDGTLIQTGGAGLRAFAETFAEEFGVRDLSGGVAFAGRSDRAIAADLMREHGIPASAENWERFRAGYLRRLPAALVARQGAILPGVISLLNELKSLDHSLIGLLTGNIQAGARQKLTHYELMDRFAFGGFGDVSGERCDIAAAALAEAKRLAAARNGRHAEPLCGVMVIGDTVHDVTCARSIGAIAVAVTTGNTSRDDLAATGPDLLLDDLSDPRPLLEIVAAAMSR